MENYSGLDLYDEDLQEIHIIYNEEINLINNEGCNIIRITDKPDSYLNDNELFSTHADFLIESKTPIGKKVLYWR